MYDWPPCKNHCDHCAPDAWHACNRPEGHRGYHSCEPTDDDYDEVGA